MNPANQSLENIKNQLITIRDSDALKNVKTDSDVAKGLAGTFQGVGGFLGTLENKSGIITSKPAQIAVKNAQGVVPTEQNAFAKLQQEYSKLNKAFEQEKSTRTALEADVSIADKRLKEQEKTGAVPTPAGTPAPKATDAPADGTTPTTTTGLDALTVNADGTPNIENQMRAQWMVETQQRTNDLLDALNQTVEFADEDTKASVRNIENSAKLAVQRMEKENARLAQAAQVAGIVSGRGQYSPYEHEGIISEVIQEGLDRVTEIENTKTEAVQAAKKAFREFRYKAFVDGSEMVAKLSEMKLDTITAMAKRLQEVEQAQREKTKFDQEQADRSALIIAPELVGATPEEITRAAYANGIEPGALMRTVDEYTRGQTEQDQADQAFALEQKIGAADLLGKQLSNQLTNIKIAGESNSNVDEMDENTRKYYEGILGDGPGKPISIPPGMSEAAIVAIRDANPNVKGEAMQEIIQREYTSTGLKVNGAVGSELVNARGVGLYQSGRNPEVNTIIDNLASEMGLESGEDLLSDPGFLITLGEEALAVQSANPDIKAGEMDIGLLMKQAATDYRTTIEKSKPLTDPSSLFKVRGSESDSALFEDTNVSKKSSIGGTDISKKSSIGGTLDLSDPFNLNELGLNKKNSLILNTKDKAVLRAKLGL